MKIEVRIESLQSALHRERQPKTVVIGGYREVFPGGYLLKIGPDGVARGKIGRKRELIFAKGMIGQITLPWPSKIEKVAYPLDPDSGGH